MQLLTKNSNKLFYKALLTKVLCKQLLTVSIFSIVFLGGIILNAGGSSVLQAQVTCTIGVCPTDIVNQYDINLKKNYSSEYFEGFSDTHALSALMTIPYVGATRIDHLTIGAQGSLGLKGDGFKVNEDNIVTGLGKNDDTKLFNGSFYAGINLGGLFDWFGIVKSILNLPSIISLHKFDILVAHYSTETLYHRKSIKYGIENSYGGLRYQLIPGASLPILGGWTGIVFGVGYLQTKVTFSKNNKENDIRTLSIAGSEFRSEEEKIEIVSELSSIPVELDTGVSILFFNITYGIGALYSSGNAKLNFKRDGALHDSSGTLQGQLQVRLKADADARREIYYTKLGFELPLLPFFKIGAQAVYSNSKAYAYGVGVRLSL